MMLKTPDTQTQSQHINCLYIPIKTVNPDIGDMEAAGSGWKVKMNKRMTRNNRVWNDIRVTAQEARRL